MGKVVDQGDAIRLPDNLEPTGHSLKVLQAFGRGRQVQSVFPGSRDRGQGVLHVILTRYGKGELGLFYSEPGARGFQLNIAGGQEFWTVREEFLQVSAFRVYIYYAGVLYKGGDRRDALGFFAPYVPLSFTKVTHADSGQPAVIAKTRYALDTIPGIETAGSTDRAAKYARTFGVDFTDTALA